MRKWITLLMTLLVGSCASYANATSGQVILEAGYRHDSLEWKNRFPSDDPFLKTSNKFSDIDIFQLGLRGYATLGCNFYIRGQAYWGWILDGDHKQSAKFFPVYDFGSDSFDFDFGFSNDKKNTIDDNYVFGVNAAIGYSFYFCDCTMMLAPVIGYSIDEQNLVYEDAGFDFNGFGAGSSSGCCFGHDNGRSCCRGTQLFRWYGPFVGLDFYYRPNCECWGVWAELEYHWGNFNGKGHHNGEDFFDKQHQHSSDMHGWAFTVGADYDVCDCWTVGIDLKFQDFGASRHHRNHFREESYFLGSGGHRSHHNFDWNSYAVNLTVGRRF